MTTQELLRRLKAELKPAAWMGLAETAIIVGGIITYHNITDLGTAANPPSNATLDNCIFDWDAENMLEFIQTVYALASYFPLTLITLISLIFLRNSETTVSLNEDLALVRDEQPQGRPVRSCTLLSWINTILSGIAGGLGLNALFETPINLVQSMDAALFLELNSNATREDCYKQWERENQVDFDSTIAFLIGGFLMGALFYQVCHHLTPSTPQQRVTQIPEERVAEGYSATL